MSELKQLKVAETTRGKSSISDSLQIDIVENFLEAHRVL